MGLSQDGTPGFATIIEFGDSLSDTGAAFALSTLLGDPLPPPDLRAVDPLTGAPTGVDLSALGVFYAGVFTNGAVFPDVTATVLRNADNDLSIADVDERGAPGNNFAVGGATVAARNADIPGNTLSAQIAQFEATVAAFPSFAASLEQSAASLFIGANDLGAIGERLASGEEADPVAAISEVTSGIADAAQRLVGAGVGTVILNTLPQANFFPASNGLSDLEILFANLATDAVNAGVRATAADLAAAGAHVEVVAFDQLAREIQNDPNTFGFLTLENVISGSGTSTDVVLNLEETPIEKAGFIDTVHFSAAMHEVFGIFQAKTLGNETIDGNFFPNLLRGDSGAQTIFAKAGPDLVTAGGGDDLIFGGDGADALFAGSGDDIAFGGLRNDAIRGGRGSDILSGGAGDDDVRGGAGADVLAGNAGDDRLFGGGAGDVLIDGLGDDVVKGGAGGDVFIWIDNEILEGEAGVDVLKGGSGTDTLVIVTNDLQTTADDAQIDAFLSANGVSISGIEARLVVSEAGLSDIESADVNADILKEAELFGLL